MKLGMITTSSKFKAWAIADRLMPNNEIDKIKSNRVGHDIYVSETGYISDIGNRLEINFDDGDYINIWVCD